MKISHIVSKVENHDNLGRKVNETEVLTHFLHFKNCTINILSISSITWNSSTDYKSVNIWTVDGVQHLISDANDIEELRKFFQRT